MTHRSTTTTHQYTRRDLLQHALVAGAAFLAHGSVEVSAQGTPVASPDTNGQYANPGALVDVAWLERRIDDPEMVTVALMPEEEFASSHVPGAVQIDWPALEVVDTSDASIDVWNQSVQDLVGSLGITTDSDVVVYDNGTLFAARLWWVLTYLGHKRVHVLNGGLAAWQDRGNEAAPAPSSAASAASAYAGSPDERWLAQMAEVVAALDDPDAVIVDARTPEEYAEGHIPGAVNLNFPLNASDTPPKRYKPAGELRSMYEAIGVTPNRLVIPYCTSGVRSAVTAHTLHLIGYQRVALYTGSWKEWSSDPDVPKATGSAP